MFRCDHCNRIVEITPSDDVWAGFYRHMDDKLQSCWSDGTETAEVKGSAIPEYSYI